VLDFKTQTAGAPATFAGHTCDISATGLAIMLPISRFSEQLLNQGHRSLRIVLELATGAIEAEAAVVRYDHVKLNDELKGLGCLVGAQIVKMRDDDRERFIEHLRSISKRGTARLVSVHSN
jgi:hypothetical protein